ncbi:MAG: PD40 domain-containing protein [Candidatus Eisenbacteria bacterium]|nr:PD40 domain-containing protein [Candidatus Eisenbacteria bacterium]
MRTRFITLLFKAMIAAAAAGCGSHTDTLGPGGPAPADTIPTVKSLSVLETDAGRVAWSQDGSLIAYDKIGADGYADVWIMNPDGTNKANLTDGKPGLPGKHMGNPAWHPSGDWIVFQAERAVHVGSSDQAAPGVGLFNDLWAIKRDGTRSYQLTTITAGCATLHPLFSHDGASMLWCESGSGLTDWAVKLGDFLVLADSVSLSNVRTLRPGNPSGAVFYETGGDFFPDNQTFSFTGNLEPGQHWTGMDIYTFQPATASLSRKTQTMTEWDEHGHVSPDGKWIVWASTRGYAFDPVTLAGYRMDLWVMRADGSGQQRLTYYNEPGHAEYTGQPMVCGDLAWSPDASKIVGYVFIFGQPNHGNVVKFELE